MNEELLKKLKSAKTPEELGALLKDAGAEELTAEQLKKLFDLLSSGALNDNNLEGAAGGRQPEPLPPPADVEYSALMRSIKEFIAPRTPPGFTKPYYGRHQFSEIIGDTSYIKKEDTT